MAERFAIAQVAPHPLEDANEVGTFAGEVSKELAARGHKVLLLAPSRSPELVRESRRLIRAAHKHPEDLFDPEGGVRVLGVGELLFNASRKGINPAPPVDIARTIEEVLSVAPLDFVHVHEPWAPSAGSVALRHSRALNVGSFHAPAERVLSTQVARKFVELFFGRMDARTASYEATAELMNTFFPSSYRLLRPGVTPEPREARTGGPLRIAFSDREERGALRLFLRALRHLPEELPWEAVVYTKTGIPTLRSSLRNRVTVVSDEDAAFAAADIVVAASLGQVTAPGVLVKALGVGAVPLAARVPVYEEVLREGDLGLHFDVGDVDVLAAQLERAIRDADLRTKLAKAGGEARQELAWSGVADQVEEIYRGLAALRHDPDPKPEVRARVKKNPLIDVDLHMHTDHSSDCATPVDVLLATARDVGLGAIAVTDHNEISGAYEAAEKAAQYGVKVIIGEEVMTADQGEVIGLFLTEKIPRGMTLEETIAEIRRQGGIVYVPHPFDRLHAVPDYEHMLKVVNQIDAIEVFNPRIAIPAFNEEAVRFAGKYRIVGGAGTDSHVAQGLGSVRITMRDFDGPEEFLESLRDADIAAKPSSLRYAQVQALKFLQTKATPPAARRATRRRKVAKAVAGRGGQ
ncbi:PHP domain-containing protein [Solirubrobacter phytolaccae]|uniref:PHP domain-containing protein n=1 Tax=Solirubrobacter phytolaccae TaxID=1404360 RepID=A0A9X3SBU9_9ACTN|nr:PHP domain-containing protein [Solirubrobacter phytolaccae]MDA0181820.1 PHP domain-containing protein [Solirubrobacter phytolaccae]